MSKLGRVQLSVKHVRKANYSGREASKTGSSNPLSVQMLLMCPLCLMPMCMWVGTTLNWSSKVLPGHWLSD